MFADDTLYVTGKSSAELERKNEYGFYYSKKVYNHK